MSEAFQKYFKKTAQYLDMRRKVMQEHWRVEGIIGYLNPLDNKEVVYVNDGQNVYIQFQQKLPRENVIFGLSNGLWLTEVNRDRIEADRLLFGLRVYINMRGEIKVDEEANRVDPYDRFIDIQKAE